jgi:hypothetical protein
LRLAHLNCQILALSCIRDPLKRLRTRAEQRKADGSLARVAGRAYDPRRLDLFSALHGDLLKLAPSHRAEPAREIEARYLPFFEAYFSNFIEGTEFEPDEAAAIVFEGRVPTERPEDAHDVLGTYRIVSDRAEMMRTPKTFEELLSQLRARHASIMEGRPDKSPGKFKSTQNRTGSTTFVAPDLMSGTLTRGYDLYRALPEHFNAPSS